jgi:phosphosulfolactate phosphohydrolase-like enzyme
VRPDGSAGQAPGGLGELTPCSSIVLVAPFIDVLRGNATVDRALSAITAAMADVV